jgi:hypothetical protein
MALGFVSPLYVPPFDHRYSFQHNMFEWNASLRL